MPLTRPKQSLYIPGQGEVSLEQKDVITLNLRELNVLAWLHEWAVKNEVNIFCKRCEQPIRGQNNDGPDSSRPSVSCQCRQWIYTG